MYDIHEREVELNLSTCCASDSKGLSTPVL